VNVSLPEQSLFVEEEKPATASVLLKLSPSFRLTQQNVAAITHLVAGGIEGMAAENVTVIDTNGNILNQAMKQGEFDFGQVATSQFQAQGQYEQKVRSALSQMLGRVFGANNVVITVATQMNFDKKQIVEKTYQPIVGDEGVIRSKQTQNEEFEGSGSTASGVPGTESNIPEYQAFQEGNNNSSNYKKEQNTTNYEMNQREIQQINAPGTVEKISVSVVVNKELDDNGIANLQNMVAAAIGYNPERGDQLTSLGMPFDNSLEKEVEDAMKARQEAETRQLMIYAAAGLVGFIFLWIIFRRSRKSSFNRAPQRLNVVIGDPETEVAATAHELSPEEKARREMRKELADLITNKPEDVAELLKTWLTED
jgi:flagellar M-ring protein FliF